VKPGEHAHLWEVLTYVRWAVEHSKLRPADRTLAVAVATYYNHEEGYARPPWHELMSTFGYGRSTLAERLAAITADGIWRTETHPRKATRYRFPIRSGVHRGPGIRTPERSTGVLEPGRQGSWNLDPNQLPEPTGVITDRDAVPRAASLNRFGGWPSPRRRDATQ